MIDKTRIEELFAELDRNARASGYMLNSDESFTLPLIEGLLVNEERYGYRACPCRLASGVKEEDLDIICPCDYRDADLADHGACYCALYVSAEVAGNIRKLKPVPDRRFADREKPAQRSPEHGVLEQKLAYPVLRCRVCGYLCAREKAPGVCPICKADSERFERFL